MVDKNQFKKDGLLFGRNLQRALKISAMYASMDHAAVDQAAQQTYTSLEPLIKQGGDFTLGFIDKRLLLNNILVGENPLTPLEAEFNKRAIGRVTFETGITLPDFKKGLAVLSVAPKTLEKAGGIKQLIQQSTLHRMRIVPGSKQRTEGEDTVLPAGSESYLLAQAILQPQAGLDDASLNFVFQAAGVEKPLGFTGSAAEIRELAGKAVQGVLENPERDLHEAVETLTHLFKQLTPEYLLASVTPDKQGELRDRSPQGLVTDLVENITVELAGKRVAGATGGDLDPAMVEDVTQILARGLKATRVAERLLQKLAQFIKDAQLPIEFNDRIRQELEWLSLPEPEKHVLLLRLERFDARDFRHLVNYVHERTEGGHADLAMEVSNHYFACLEKSPAQFAVEHLNRVPELFKAMAGSAALEFLHILTDHLCAQLLDEKRLGRGFHQQVASCLTGVAQGAAGYDDFKLVQCIGAELQSSLGRDPAQHADCCSRALQSLLTPSAVDRLIGLFLENRDDAIWAKTAINLLKLPGGVGAERAFERLSEEPLMSNRLRLLRLIGNLGPSATEPARKRLADPRWYVVRNACFVLGNLGGPDLATQLRVALHHPEVRVQQAAVTAIIRNPVPKRAEVLAEALPDLKGQVLDLALDELTLLKDPAIVGGVERFISQTKDGRAGSLGKAVKVLAAIPSDRAADVLSRLLSDTGLALSVRRAALIALSFSTSPQARRLMDKFSQLDPKDELVAECQSLLLVSHQ